MKKNTSTLKISEDKKILTVNFENGKPKRFIFDEINEYSFLENKNKCYLQVFERDKFLKNAFSGFLIPIPHKNKNEINLFFKKHKIKQKK